MHKHTILHFNSPLYLYYLYTMYLYTMYLYTMYKQFSGVRRELNEFLFVNMRRWNLARLQFGTRNGIRILVQKPRGNCQHIPPANPQPHRQTGRYRQTQTDTDTDTDTDTEKRYIQLHIHMHNSFFVRALVAFARFVHGG